MFAVWIKLFKRKSHKKHYVDYHQIKENDTYFKDLFLPDT